MEYDLAGCDDRHRQHLLQHLCKIDTGAGQPFFVPDGHLRRILSICFAGFLLFPGRDSLTAEIGRLNWVSAAFGLCLVGLEFGYIMAYRAGWKVSFLSLTANIVLACVLLVLGVFLYKEGISPKQLLGMAMCMGGLVLISR